MPDTRTIFLATDGRYVTVGHGDVDLPEQTIEGVESHRLSGWRVVLSGSLYGKRAPKLDRREAIGDATDAQWDAAVAAFLGQRG